MVDSINEEDEQTVTFQFVYLRGKNVKSNIVC